MGIFVTNFLNTTHEQGRNKKNNVVAAKRKFISGCVLVLDAL